MNIAIRILLSAVFAALGVVGLVMPMLPGWLFFGVVVLLLFPDAKLTRAGVARLEKHLPSARRLLRLLVPPRSG